MTPPTWLNTAEIASYARCHPVTVRKAYAEYRQSKGKRGLRNVQTRKNAPHLALPEWVERWMAGQPPTAESGRVRAA